MSRKREVLSQLSDQQLLELAESASETPLNSKIGRGGLIEIVKENLSFQEIGDRVNKLRREAITPMTSQSALRSGGIGQVFLAASSIIGTIYSSFIGYSPLASDSYTSAAPWGIASSALLFVFATMLGFSMFKAGPRLSSNTVGKAASALGFLTASTMTVYYASTLLGITIVSSGYGYYTLNTLGVLLMTTSSIFFGSTLILLGAFFLLHHKQSSSGELWLATGIVYMFAGSVMFSYLTYYMIPTMTILAGVMGATCFLMTKSPLVH